MFTIQKQIVAMSLITFVLLEFKILLVKLKQIV